MHYCINLIHSGFISAMLAFFIWSLPGAIGMYGLSLGVDNISSTLPRQVYALLSGLNAATVGIIALAGVQLSQKAVTDKMTRIIVFLSAAAGMMYTALWYLPVLMLLGGLAAVVHDFRWLHGPVHKVAGLFQRKKSPQPDSERVDEVELPTVNAQTSVGADKRNSNEASSSAAIREGSISSKKSANLARNGNEVDQQDSAAAADDADASESERVIPQARRLNMSWKNGLIVIGLFFVIFIVVMVLRGTLEAPPLLYQLFANMFLAGTIIFGGGPVVIPLLRDYVVEEGWVSPRDFLIGLAIIQAFPGPNFNFAVYLGGLTTLGGGQNAALGALMGYIGIFWPGIMLVHGTMGIWAAIRNWRFVKSMVRGVNAAAVGLIYTAVYRLWQIGYIDIDYQQGTSLATEPWWVVVTATSYVGGMWFKMSPPVAIVLGGAMGMIWYGVVTA
jgi:chromate transport protein ChrA